MKKYYSVLFSAAALVLAACVGPGEEPDKTPGTAPEEGTTYPRVQLIEHFTGEKCGYCPGGMDYIYEEYSKNPDGIIWVSNHYGYGQDEYTVTGSSAVGEALGVQGAPNISLNREQYTLDGEKSRSYHPYYTAQVLKKTKSEATEKVEIETTYDAAARKLNLKVSCLTSRKDLAGAMLTVVITESGMQGAQSDFYGSWEGWSKFIHTHTVRKYITKALGDDYLFDKQTFEAEYEVVLADKWVAENCQVAAWITELDTKYPVLNAAKAVVVPGSKGGEDIKHGGVEATPVPATYPESGAPATNLVLNQAQATYYPVSGATMFELVAANLANPVTTVSNTQIFPYVSLILVTEAGATSIPAGEYTFASPAEAGPGNAVMGVRDDEQFQTLYSQFYYVYPTSNGLGAYKQWLLQTGKVVVSATGFTLQATTLNGSTVSASFEGQIPCKAGQAYAPARKPAL